MRRAVRLTEEDLERIVAECAGRVLAESGGDEPGHKGTPMPEDDLQWIRRKTFYHWSTDVILGEPRVPLKNGFSGDGATQRRSGCAFYIAADKKFSAGYGDILHSVRIRPRKMLVLMDGEAISENFCNLTREENEMYRGEGYDSIARVVMGQIKEIAILDPTIAYVRPLGSARW